MKAQFQSSYRNKLGTLVFAYIVIGSVVQLAAYKEAKGENYREDENGKPLWFTTRFAGNNVELGISTKTGNVYANTSVQDTILGLAKEHSLSIKDAKDLYDMMNVGKTASAPAQVEAKTSTTDELGEM